MVCSISLHKDGPATICGEWGQGDQAQRCTALRTRNNIVPSCWRRREDPAPTHLTHSPLNNKKHIYNLLDLNTYFMGVFQNSLQDLNWDYGPSPSQYDFGMQIGHKGRLDDAHKWVSSEPPPDDWLRHGPWQGSGRTERGKGMGVGMLQTFRDVHNVPTSRSLS